MAAWYDVDGIHLAPGDRARYVTTAQIIPWESAVQRIGQLLEAGQFASNVELLEAEGYERQLLSQSLLNLYHDIDMQNGIADSLPSLRVRSFAIKTFPKKNGVWILALPIRISVKPFWPNIGHFLQLISKTVRLCGITITISVVCCTAWKNWTCPARHFPLP